MKQVRIIGNCLFSDDNIVKGGRKMRLLRKYSKLIPLLVVLCVLTGGVAYGSYTMTKFSGYIQSYKKNTRFDHKHRSTKDTQNPWRVTIDYSGKGKGTTTTFWLEDFYGNNVSQDVDAVYDDIHQYLCPAYSSASDIDVYLTGENDVWNSEVYYIEGRWSPQDN